MRSMRVTCPGRGIHVHLVEGAVSRMLRTLGVVQVPWERLRLKSGFRRRLGGKSLVEWVVRRMTECQRLDGVILLVGESEIDRQVADLAPSDVPVFTARGADELSRLAATVDEYSPQAIVRVSSGTPFVDPGLLDRLVSTADGHEDCDYISYLCHDGRPAIHSPIGVYGEWVKGKAIRRAARRATLPLDRQHATRYLYSHPEDFSVRLIPAPVRLDRDDVRLTVDLEEDWEHCQDIFDALGPEVDWQRITGLLDHQPALRSRMQVLNRNAAT